MMSSIDPTLLYTAVLSALLMAGCDTSEPADSPQAVEAEAQKAPAETLTLELALPADTDPELVEAIAKSAEAHAGPDVQGAKVKATKKDDGPLVLEVELWGDLDDESVILERLRKEHEILNLTPVAVERVEGGPADDDLGMEFADDATPEEIEAQVRAKLIESGHDLKDGELHVDVSDDEDGHRRVEVRVEKSETTTSDEK